jgi:hypothetical protein
MTESAPKRRRSLSQEAPSKRPALGTLSGDPSPTQWNIALPEAPAGPPNLQIRWALPHETLLDAVAIEKEAPPILLLLWRALGPGAVEHFVTSCFPHSPASQDISDIALSLTVYDQPPESFMMCLHLATGSRDWEPPVRYSSAMAALNAADRHPYRLDESMSPHEKGEYAFFAIAMPLTTGYQSCGRTSSPLAPPSTNSAVYPESAGRR